MNKFRGVSHTHTRSLSPSPRLPARFQLKIKVNECGNVITKPYKLNLYAQYNNNEMCASVCHTFHSVCVWAWTVWHFSIRVVLPFLEWTSNIFNEQHWNIWKCCATLSWYWLPFRMRNGNTLLTYVVALLCRIFGGMMCVCANSGVYKSSTT